MGVRRIGALLVIGAALAGCGAGTTTPSPAASGSAAIAGTPTPGAASPTDGQPSPSASRTPRPEYDSPFEVSVGQCFNPIEDKDDGALLAILLKDCEDEHLAEAFALFDLDHDAGEPWPGDDEVDDAAEEGCDAEFEAYVGIPFDDSEYNVSYFTPSPESWEADDREVLCLIEGSPRAPLIGSAEGTEL